MKEIKKISLAFVLFGVVMLGGFLTTRVVSKNFSIDKVKLISDMPSIRDAVAQHQKDALYVPYKIRLIIFNKSIYVYQVLRNIANFWNLDNFNKIFLWGNFYPIILGLRTLWLKQRDKFWICISGLSAGSLVIGLNKMTDARGASWFMLPIFVYLFFKGIKKINKKVYACLLAISIFFLL
jgi:hypothetical protein